MPSPFEPMNVDVERAAVGIDMAADESYPITVEGDAESGFTFTAPSMSYGKRKKYKIFRDVDGKWKCMCPDYLGRRKPCKHIVCVVKRYYPNEAPELSEIALKALRTSRLSIVSDDVQIERVRAPHVAQRLASPLSESTLKDHAIVRQPKRMISLLCDLSETMNRSRSAVRLQGGQFINAGDLAFMMLDREYLGLSQRLYESTMHDRYRDGYISEKRCRTSRHTYQNSIKTHEMLTELYRLVISVFRLESAFFIDGTGLSPYYVSNYFERMHGEGDIRTGTQWVHCHAVIGEWSKAILGFKLTKSEGDGNGEITQFSKLLRWLESNGFKNGKFVGADNLYLFKQCFDAARLHNMELIGPTQPRNFEKKSGLPKALYAEMLKVIAANKVERIVKKRALIEASFGEMKRKGKHMIMCVGSTAERTADPSLLLYVSRRNELLCRVIVQVLKRINAMEVLTEHEVSFRNERPFPVEAFALMRDCESNVD